MSVGDEEHRLTRSAVNGDPGTTERNLQWAQTIRSADVDEYEHGGARTMMSADHDERGLWWSADYDERGLWWARTMMSADYDERGRWSRAILITGDEDRGCWSRGGRSADLWDEEHGASRSADYVTRNTCRHEHRRRWGPTRRSTYDDEQGPCSHTGDNRGLQRASGLSM